MNTQTKEVAILKDTLITRLVVLEGKNDEFLQSILDIDSGENGFAYAWEYPGLAQTGGTFINQEFRPLSPDQRFIWNNTYSRWDPPVEKPQDTPTTVYHWDYENFEWKSYERTKPEEL